MANTNDLRIITEYALDVISNKMGTRLISRNLPIGQPPRAKAFSGVSSDGSIVVQVNNNSGYTSGGKIPTAKIKMIYSDCYFMNLSKAKRKILAFTNEEFYKIFSTQSQGFLPDFELFYIDLPQELKDLARRVTEEASKEMTK